MAFSLCVKIEVVDFVRFCETHIWERIFCTQSYSCASEALRSKLCSHDDGLLSMLQHTVSEPETVQRGRGNYALFLRPHSTCACAVTNSPDRLQHTKIWFRFVSFPGSIPACQRNRLFVCCAHARLCSTTNLQSPVQRRA